jgi:hypothetical protein
VRSAYSGRVANGAYTIRAYTYDGDPTGGGGDSRPRVDASTCAALAAADSCTTSSTEACLFCTSNGGATVCGN